MWKQSNENCFLLTSIPLKEYKCQVDKFSQRGEETSIAGVREIFFVHYTKVAPCKKLICNQMKGVRETMSVGSKPVG